MGSETGYAHPTGDVEGVGVSVEVQLGKCQAHGAHVGRIQRGRVQVLLAPPVPGLGFRVQGLGLRA